MFLSLLDLHDSLVDHPKGLASGKPISMNNIRYLEMEALQPQLAVFNVLAETVNDHSSLLMFGVDCLIVAYQEFQYAHRTPGNHCSYSI
ncbi:hypothetical protein SNK05_013609 [Fusarium graminearum]